MYAFISNKYHYDGYTIVTTHIDISNLKFTHMKESYYSLVEEFQ